MNAETEQTYLKTLERGLEYHRKGQYEEAQAAYLQIPRESLYFAESRHLLGGIQQSLGYLEEAEALIRQAIQLAPQHAVYHANLAGVLLNSRQAEPAQKAALEALRIEAGIPEAKKHLGSSYLLQGKAQKALACYREVLKVRPRDPELWNHIAAALRALQQFEQAEEAFRQALAIAPNYRDALINFGGFLLSQHRALEAEPLLEQAYRLKQDSPELLENLAGVYQIQGKFRETEKLLKEGLKRFPDRILWPYRAAVTSPVVFPSKKAITYWRRSFMKQLKTLRPLPLENVVEELDRGYIQPPYHLAYQGENNLRLKSDYADLFQLKLHPSGRRRKRPKIGLLVTAGHEGIFAKCCLGILNQIKGREADFHLIAPETAYQYLLRQGLQNKVLKVTLIPNRLSGALKVLNQSCFDLIHYWEVGSDGLNYFLPFFRPAPIQSTSWGTAETSGLSQIDYYISSRAWEDESGQADYRENLILLDRIPTYYFKPETPETKTTQIREHFGLPKQGHVYFCAQNLFKLHPDFDLILAAILEKDPWAEILLVEGKQTYWSQLIKERFQKTIGPLCKRIRWLPRLDYQSYLALVAAADVMLDSLHFSGGNTSYEALAMGTPIITFPGRFIRGRFTLGCYRQMGISDGDLIVNSEKAYVEKAVAIASNQELRDKLSQKIESKHHHIFSDESAITELEKMLCELSKRQ